MVVTTPTVGRNHVENYPKLTVLRMIYTSPMKTGGNLSIIPITPPITQVLVRYRPWSMIQKVSRVSSHIPLTRYIEHLKFVNQTLDPDHLPAAGIITSEHGSRAKKVQLNSTFQSNASDLPKNFNSKLSSIALNNLAMVKEE